MENFIVSARKYRPTNFDSVVGQEAIVTTLKNAIKNNLLAQAFLFCGPRGVGKTSCARVLAKTINCENISENAEACDICPSCKSFNESSSFNVHELDAASNNSVDDIRNLVDQVRVPPQAGKYKIYIIDEVHMLSQAAFNAFLKTLEEPPPYAKFILATTEKHKIIPTIMSRCQIYDFKRISVEDIAKHLTFVAKSELIDAEPDALHIIAQKADGALRDALSLFDQMVTFGGNKLTYHSVISSLNILDFDYFFRFTDLALQSDFRSSLLLINEVVSNGFDGQHVLSGMSDHLRNLLVAKDPQTAMLLETGDGLRSRYLEQAKMCSDRFLFESLRLINDADVNFKQAHHKRLQLEVVFMRLSYLQAYLTGQNNSAEAKKKSITEDEVGNYSIPESNINNVSEPKNLNDSAAKPEAEINKQSEKTKTAVSPRQFKLSQQEQENKLEESSQIAVQKKKSLFGKAEFDHCWKEFTASLDEFRKSFISILSTCEYTLNDEFVIGVTVTGNAELQEFEDNKSDILQFLRTNLDNDYISIQLNVIQAPVSQYKGMTVEEKLNAMMVINPELGDFCTQLKLEPEM